MPIRGEGLVDEIAQQVGQTHGTIYVLHPNCAVEEM